MHPVKAATKVITSKAGTTLSKVENAKLPTDVLDKAKNFTKTFIQYQDGSINLPGSKSAPKGGPRVTVRDHYAHHNAMRADVINQLEGQGYTVSQKEVTFGSSCGTGRCRPDIIYEAPDGTKGIIEIKTGNADLSIRQKKSFRRSEMVMQFHEEMLPVGLAWNPASYCASKDIHMVFRLRSEHSRGQVNEDERGYSNPYCNWLVDSY